MAQFIQVMLGLGVLSSKASPGNSDPPGTTVQVPSKVRPSRVPIPISASYFLRDCEKIKTKPIFLPSNSHSSLLSDSGDGRSDPSGLGCLKV